MNVPMNQPNAPVQALFSRIAPVYDQLNDWLSFGQHRVWKRLAVKWSRAKLGDRALDVCCGSGDLALLLAQQVGPSGQVVGLDFAAPQLAIARHRAYLRVLDPFIDWIEGDALALPFEANQFDAATMGYGLRNVLSPLQSLEELHRVLKPGAIAAILDFHKPDRLEMESFQQGYLQHFVVPLAQHFELGADYAYIADSLARFPRGPEQVKLAHCAGFEQAVHYPLAAGMMGILVVSKAKISLT